MQLDTRMDVTIKRVNENVFAHCCGRTVGRLRAHLEDAHTALLTDIQVDAFCQTRSGRLADLIRLLFPWYGSMSLRGKGIGTRLLEEFLTHCRISGVRKVYGSIPATSAADASRLLAWFEQHGFEGFPLCHACLPEDTIGIVWKRERQTLPQPNEPLLSEPVSSGCCAYGSRALPPNLVPFPCTAERVPQHADPTGGPRPFRKSPT